MLIICPVLMKLAVAIIYAELYPKRNRILKNFLFLWLKNLGCFVKKVVLNNRTVKLRKVKKKMLYTNLALQSLKIYVATIVIVDKIAAIERVIET